MTSLFDVSAIYNIVLRTDKDSWSIFKNNYMIALTPYELGNIAWKHVVRGDLTTSEGLDIVALVKTLANVMHVIPLDMDDMPAIFSLANDKRISFYDASYLHYAKTREFLLVTDDGKLAQAAEPAITVISTDSL